MKDERNSLVGVERTVRILRALEQAEQVNLADLARSVQLSEATVLRYLNSLVAAGFVERSDLSRYRLGWEIFRLGQRALSGHVPRGAVRPAMEALLAEFNETVNLAYRKGDEVVIVEVFEGMRAVKKISDVGQSDPWHASALGKALMATMPDAEWQRLLAQAGMPALTSHTIRDVPAMQAEIDTIRRQGHAVDHEESDEDLTCVAVVVPAPSGMPQFALSVSFLTYRLAPGTLDHAAVRVAEAADQIGRRLY